MQKQKQYATQKKGQTKKMPQKVKEAKSMIFKDKAALFIQGIRGLSNSRAEELSQEFTNFGGKVIKLNKVNKDNFQDTLKSLDYIFVPKQKSHQKSLAQVADKLRVPYDALTNTLQQEGIHITVLSPQWLQECISRRSLVDQKGYSISVEEKAEGEVQGEEKEEEEGEHLRVRFSPEKIEKESLKEEEKQMLLQESAGKSTYIGETPQKSERLSDRKRKHVEYSAEIEEFFIPPTDERFSYILKGIHNDLVKDPMTLKRAPLNNDIIEELEQIRLNYKGKADEVKELEYKNTLKFLKDLNQPIYDASSLEDFPNISAEVKYKIQEYLSKGEIDEMSLLRNKPPLWQWTMKDQQEKQQQLQAENPALLFQEGFKTAMEVKKHKDLLSQEQKMILQFYQDFEQEVTREDAEKVLEIIKKEVAQLFEGADQIFQLEACGQYRRGEYNLKDLDILITMNDEGPTKYFLVKLLEILEGKGLIVQQLKDIRLSASGSVGFQGVFRLPDSDRNIRIDINVYPKHQYPFSLMYFTGPPGFIQWIRDQAYKRGYSISDCDMVPRRKETFLNPENQPGLVYCETEEDIFKALNLDYIPPEKRKHYSLEQEEITPQQLEEF